MSWSVGPKDPSYNPQHTMYLRVTLHRPHPVVAAPRVTVQVVLVLLLGVPKPIPRGAASASLRDELFSFNGHGKRLFENRLKLTA